MDLYSGIINRLSLYAIFLLLKSNVWFPFFVAIPHFSDTFMSELTMTPTYFPFPLKVTRCYSSDSSF